MADERGKLSWLCHDDSTKNTAQIISIIIAVVVITFYCITLQLKWYSITNTKHTTVLYFRDVLALKLSQNFPDMLYRNLNKHILNLFYPFSLITVVYKAAPAKAEVTYIMWLITKQNDRGATSATKCVYLVSELYDKRLRVPEWVSKENQYFCSYDILFKI